MGRLCTIFATLLKIRNYFKIKRNNSKTPRWDFICKAGPLCGVGWGGGDRTVTVATNPAPRTEVAVSSGSLFPVSRIFVSVISSAPGVCCFLCWPQRRIFSLEAEGRSGDPGIEHNVESSSLGHFFFLFLLL